MCRHHTWCNVDVDHGEPGSVGTVQLVDDSDANADSGTGHTDPTAKRGDSEAGTGTCFNRTGTIAEHSDADAHSDLHNSAQPSGTW